jgi:hypothetical protein
VQHLVLSAYEHRHSLHEVGAVQTTNIPLLQSKHSLEQSFHFSEHLPCGWIFVSDLGNLQMQQHMPVCRRLRTQRSGSRTTEGSTTRWSTTMSPIPKLPTTPTSGPPKCSTCRVKKLHWNASRSANKAGEITCKDLSSHRICTLTNTVRVTSKVRVCVFKEQHQGET